MNDSPMNDSEMNDSLWQRLRDLVVAPRRLMEGVGTAPRWWVPGLLIFLVIGGFSWVAAPISGPEQLELMRDSKIMRLMTEDVWQQQYEQALDPEPGKRALQALGAGFSGWIMIILFGFILGFFVRMSGGQGTFKQALGVVSWASLIPFGIGPLVKLPLVLKTESVYKVTIGLAALIPDRDPSSALSQVLMTYGDFFTWWGLAVLVVGFSAVFGLSRNSATVAVLLPWALASAIPLGIGLLFM
jgi:hypothetical protein